MRTITMKFGGTSVGSGEAILRTAELIVASAMEDQRVVAVVSAMSGVTDLLIKAARSAETGESDAFRSARTQLLGKHLQAAGVCVAEQERDAVWDEATQILDRAIRLCEAVAVVGELTDRGLDAIISSGERMSARLVAAAVRRLGRASEAADATAFVVTDRHHGAALPQLDATRTATREYLLPKLEAGIIPIVTGFIGASPTGAITTLGRGGSDYSASLLGAALDSEEIWIWTDVDGVMTADPRLVPHARSLPAITYTEAAELAYFGAKVLHPKTMVPAQVAGTPIRIKNSFHPDHPGTLITADAPPPLNKVRGITAMRGLSVVTVQGRGMMGVPGMAAKMFSAVAREGISVLVITQSSSEQNICIVIPATSASRAITALREEFAQEIQRQDVDEISAQNDVGVVAVVGAGMKGTPGVASRVFSALGDTGINVVCIAQGSSEHNLSFVIADADISEAVRVVHDSCCNAVEIA